jgi:hypothetical protein
MTWFPTKIDGWLAALLGLTLVGTVAAAVAALVAGEGVLVSLLALVLLAAIFGGLVFPMRYGIGEGELVVRHGLVRQRCKLSEIVEVTPTRSPLSSPALSLDRLLVRKGDRFTDKIMISPADKQGFMNLLAEQAGLVRDGDRLLRPPPL